MVSYGWWSVVDVTSHVFMVQVEIKYRLKEIAYHCGNSMLCPVSRGMPIHVNRQSDT